MPDETRYPFLEVFSAYHPMSGGLFEVLAQAQISDLQVNMDQRVIQACFFPKEPISPALFAQVQRELTAAYELHALRLECPPTLLAEKARPAAAKPAAPRAAAPGGQAVLGKITGKKTTPIAELNIDMGRAIVEGDVFAVNHRKLKNSPNNIISFDITDYKGSVRVTRFLSAAESEPVLQKVQTGCRVRVQGQLVHNRYENDFVFEPGGIALVKKKEARADTAPNRRVELHLHTNMSAMDALSDAGAVVRRAAAWGHRAVAITDHGVVHSFPEAAAAAKGKDIKVIYGVEAYFENDVDATAAVMGERGCPLDGPFVVFDVETTGLSARRDAVIEIGAVVVEKGRLTGERFSTFIDPQRPVPAVIRKLTGIHDGMLRGAPREAEAIDAFLTFVNGRPVAAHNADFDVSFIAAAAGRLGVSFLPIAVDTLTIARGLYPGLPNHKLNTVAAHLQLGDFTHHRAVDDAEVTARILAAQIAALKERGVSHTGQIQEALRRDREGLRPRRSYHHLIILAKNQTGLRNLYKLISLSHLEYFTRFPVMPKSLINENREGLILGSACEAGELFSAIVDGKSDGELRRIAAWYDYLEIQPRSNNAFLLQPDKNGRQRAQDEQELAEFNRTVVRLGTETGKPVCATGDVHFIDPQDEVYRHILLVAKGFEDGDRSNPLYLRTTEEMLEEFSYLGSEKAYEVVVTNTNLVADWCQPVSPLPKGLYPPTLENSAEELSALVWGRARELYGETLPAPVEARIHAELGDILRCKYDVIYMSAQKLVQNSLENGYLVGSRGSVGSSIVAFLSGITEVNSLGPHYRCPRCKHSDFDAGQGYGCGVDMPDQSCPVCGTPYAKDGFEIPFETFLGFGGDKVPDIDLNFAGEHQTRAHRQTSELFGENHVFRAGTIGTVAEKTAYGYVKKYMEACGRQVSRAEEARLALGCTGVKRTTGQHPGGMVIIPQTMEVYDFCPVQRPADDKQSNIITTHFEYHAMEANLLKLDELGHDDPSMIHYLQQLTGVDPCAIALDDPATMSIFTSSEALGFSDDKVLGPTGACAIPEFGTGFVRQMLLDTEPTEFSTLVRLSGFSHGTDVWLGNAKDLILSGTATVAQAIGCRDDIMLDLIRRGMDERRAFQIMESVRKGKGLPSGAAEEMRAIGVAEWYIISCEKIKYLFPKAHAVAYVMMAFRIAWFKVHHPLAFYAAYFSVRAKAFDAAIMCQGMGLVKAKMAEIQNKEKPTAVEQDMLTTLEVCYEFYLRGFSFETIDLYRSDALKFVPDTDRATILPPFISVAGLGETAAQSLAEQRGKGDGAFLSVAELLAVCPKLSRAHVEGLRAAGALDGLPESSQLSLF